MEFVQLRASLKSNLSPVYVLFGTDSFLINKSIELIAENTASSTIDRFNEETPVRGVLASANTFDMFGGKRVVLVRGVDDKLFKDKDLLKYLSSPNSDCVLILVSSSEKAPTIKNAEIVNCNPLTGEILMKLIAKQFQDCGKNITSDAAAKLAQFTQNNFARISGEINKLVNYYIDEAIIQPAHIDALVTKEEEFQTYEFSNAVLSGNLRTATHIQENLSVSGTDDYAIFGSLLATMRRVFYALSTSSSGDDVAKLLKVNPYSIVYTRRDYRTLGGKIKSLYKHALDLEYQIKSGQLSPLSAINILMMLKDV